MWPVENTALGSCSLLAISAIFMRVEGTWLEESQQKGCEAKCLQINFHLLPVVEWMERWWRRNFPTLEEVNHLRGKSWYCFNSTYSSRHSHSLTQRWWGWNAGRNGRNYHFQPNNAKCHSFRVPNSWGMPSKCPENADCPWLHTRRTNSLIWENNCPSIVRILDTLAQHFNDVMTRGGRPCGVLTYISYSSPGTSHGASLSCSLIGQVTQCWLLIGWCVVTWQNAALWLVSCCQVPAALPRSSPVKRINPAQCLLC